MNEGLCCHLPVKIRSDCHASAGRFCFYFNLFNSNISYFLHFQLCIRCKEHNNAIIYMPFKYFNLKWKKINKMIFYFCSVYLGQDKIEFLHLSFYSGMNSYRNFKLILHSIWPHSKLFCKFYLKQLHSSYCVGYYESVSCIDVILTHA